MGSLIDGGNRSEGAHTGNPHKALAGHVASLCGSQSTMTDRTMTVHHRRPAYKMSSSHLGFVNHKNACSAERRNDASKRKTNVVESFGRVGIFGVLKAKPYTKASCCFKMVKKLLMSENKIAFQYQVTVRA